MKKQTCLKKKSVDFLYFPHVKTTVTYICNLAVFIYLVKDRKSPETISHVQPKSYDPKSEKSPDVLIIDDKKIIDIVQKHGGKAMLTSKKHKNGTERIYEVAKKIKNAKLIIDIQGDQPLVDPADIDIDEIMKGGFPF